MSKATDETPKCPTCEGPLTYVKDAPVDIRPTTKGVSVAPASEIYSCPQHGLWRIVMGGGTPIAYQDPDA
jgi:hypothetical protein